MVKVDEAIYPWRGKRWCHMQADTLHELQVFAYKLGLKPEWIQHADSPWYVHYDLTETKRARALQMGAVFLPARQQAKERLAKMREAKAA